MSLCRKIISSDRLLLEARRKPHPCMLRERVRIPRACAEIWSSHTANMKNDLIKNHQLACEGDPIPRAYAEKMKLSEPQNGSSLRVSNQNVIRVCYSSVWEIHEPVQENALEQTPSRRLFCSKTDEMITRKSQDNSFPLDVPCNCAYFFCKPTSHKLKSNIEYLYVVIFLASARAGAQLLKWVSFSKAFQNQPKMSLRFEGVQKSWGLCRKMNLHTQTEKQQNGLIRFTSACMLFVYVKNWWFLSRKMVLTYKD